MKIYKENVVVSLQMEGVHNWPACPYDDVAFLRSPHRHIFHIRAWKEVSHSDRDIEIIMLKRSIQETLLERYGDNLPGVSMRCLMLGSCSCEMLAKFLIDTFELSACSVLEDNESGSYTTVTYI